MLEIRNLCSGYPGKEVLKNINSAIPEGKVTVLLGPNGCGKSTLMKSLCGILPVSKGEVFLNEQALSKLPQKELARKIAYLPQNRQIPDITVERLVLHGRFPYLSYPRHYRQQDYEAAREAMIQMGIEELSDTPLYRLSGGQRQKVYIAMALAQNAPVILLDEPTTYLDVGNQLQLLKMARDLADRGKTVIMVLHDLPHALQTADRIILLQEGNVVTSGTVEEVYASHSLEHVFQVKLSRMMTDSGWQYYYEK